MDAIKLLINDHDKVRQLFRDFNGGGGLRGLVRRSVSSVTTGERRRAVRRVCKELEMHTWIEEQIFYPAVTALEDRELERQVDEALREHATVKEEVARLKGTKGDEAGLNDQMSQLEHDVEHHATEEENEMFPRLEELMSADKREDLARQMRALKRRSAATGSRRQTTRKRTRPGAKRHGARSTGSTHAKLTARTKGSGRANASTATRSPSPRRPPPHP